MARTLFEFGGFADGQSETSPDSEQIELCCGEATYTKLCERGANTRQPPPRHAI